MKVIRHLTPMALFVFAVLVAVVLGKNLRTERFLTPEQGAGYFLGIAGGSAMLLLLLYPARKRLRWLGFIGSVKGWFQTHMVLGLLGPLLILFHSNFQTGATNSNVALFCMLIVSSSGLMGRFFYARIHVEFYGRQATLAELRENAERLQQVTGSIPFLPDLAQGLAHAESRLVAGVEGIPYVVRPLVVAARAWAARRRLNNAIQRALHTYAASAALTPSQLRRLQQVAHDFVMRRIEAAQRVADFHAYERLFSLWHVLHLPLFFMLLIAGIVHVIAVHVY